MNASKYDTFLRYAWGTRKIHIVCALLAIAALTFLVRPWIGEPNSKWWNWMEPITGASTLVVAILVWFNEVNQDWDNSLPKRLSVTFSFEGKKVMVCERAYLAGEGDIRQWGQQLGRQMAGDRTLSFEPSIKQTAGKQGYDGLSGGRVKLYTVEFQLTELPKGSKESEELAEKFRDGKYLYWQPNDQQIFRKEWRDMETAKD
jgi:hypothetical protein